MLKPDSFERVVKFDIHSEVIGIQLQLVAGTNPAVFGDVHRERRHRRIEGKPPVLVARRLGLIIHCGWFGLCLLTNRYVHTVLLLQIRLQRRF